MGDLSAVGGTWLPGQKRPDRRAARSVGHEHRVLQAGHEDRDRPGHGRRREQAFFVLRTYTVFNADQVEGAEQFQVTEEPSDGEAQPDFAPAEELIAATGADIRHGGERAFYSPVGDFIQLPNRERFGSLGAYYETALHELCALERARQQLDRQ